MTRFRKHAVLAVAAALVLATGGALQAAIIVNASPASRTVARGNAATYTISWSPGTFFETSCSLAVSSAPAGAGMSLSSAVLWMGQSATLTVGTSNMSLGMHTFTVRGTSNLGSSSVRTLTVTVTAPSFTAATNLTSIIADQYEARTVTVTTSPIGATVGGVNLEVLSAIPDVAILPGSTSMTSSDTRTLGITIGAAAPYGVHQVLLRATLGLVVRNMFVTLTIGPRPKSWLASPGLPIPDSVAHAPAMSSITVAAGTPIRSIDVRINIVHQHRGDLRIVLIDPAAQWHVLRHPVPMDSGTVVDTVFPTVTSPVESLTGLVGSSPIGTWTLAVWDLAAGAVGVLKSWSLILDARQDVACKMNIPENTANGALSSLSFSGPGAVKAVHVRVDIRHPERGQLRVVLIAPGGQVLLHNHTGGTSANLMTLYPEVTPAPGLAALIDTPIAGTWQLFVADEGPLSPYAIQMVDAWSIMIEPE